MNGDARRRRRRGFTLIELLVVMAIIGTLLTIAVPRYYRSLERARETVLRQDLSTMRDVLDKFHGDTGKWPESLAALVERRYLRQIPIDPIAKTADLWVQVHADDPDDPGVRDVRSGAEGVGQNGIAYAEW